MLPPLGNGTLHNLVEKCRACRAACERFLDQLAPAKGYDPTFSDTLRCVALLSVIGDRLDAAEAFPTELVDAAVELARELSEDAFGCALACQVAADALEHWLDGSFER